MTARNIIVTGTFGILGAAVAKAFATRGDRVAKIDYAPAPAAPLDQGIDIGGIDLTDPAAAAAAVEQAATVMGSIDVLVNVAGGFAWQTVVDGSSESWQRMFAMNAMTCLNAIKAALPYLEKSAAGRIVNIGAGGAVTAAAGMGSYAASKGAVHRLTESLAAELADGTVTVNAVLPSIIDTPTNRADMPDADFSQWVRPDAIADVILFLASPAARGISGALIPVSRGG
ncbi:MAG: SDR family NAD(P)-dependent oxidoreductase [Sphingomonas sp.]